MQFLFLRALKPYVTLLFAGMLLFTTGCEDDDHDHDHDEDHTDADGFVLETEAGVEVYREFEGTQTGGVTLSVGETLELMVHFLDHEGNEIEHSDDEHDDHDDHDDHDHKKKDDHDDHDDHAGHEGHHHGEHDPHIWLDPMNAKVIVKEIEKQLVKLDPDNSSKYKANSKKAQSELDNLTRNIKKDLKGNLRFVVFHDAYQYFENRFGIKVLGALTVNPDVLPGAEQLSEIREVIEHEKVNCLFSEPQFNPAIIKSIAKDTKIKTGVLDPLGATLDKGKGMYSELLQSMYASFKGC